MNKEQFIAVANEAGWTVTGHNWLRLTKGDEQIEVWYAGDAPRMVSASLRTVTGKLRRLNVVRDRAMPLVDAVLLWVAKAHPLMDLQMMSVLAAPSTTHTPPAPENASDNERVAGNVAVSA